MQLEAGRIDLNFADEPLLMAASAANEFSEDDARNMAARIVDWRDADDSSLAGGAERREYRRADRRSGPRNGPFGIVSELQQILGGERITHELLDAFTVYSHSANVRQDAAVPRVIKALRWAHTRQLAGRVWLDEAAHIDASYDLPNLAGEALRLKACSEVELARTCRTTIIRLTGNRSDPALVFFWR